MDRRAHSALAGACMAAALVCAIAPAAAAAPAGITVSAGASGSEAGDLAAAGWIWPLDGLRVVRPFVAPPHRFGPGHRGIDLEPTGGGGLRAPADGTVAFAGDVAGRGILTIDHGGGLVSTLEPVVSDLQPGTAVARGEAVGAVSGGGHARPGTVHFGVRLDGEYINPQLLLGGLPRAVLLPCCADPP